VHRLMKSRIAIACLVALAGPSLAAPRANHPADWLKKPTPEELLAVWPRAGLGRPGHALVHCIATVQGTLRDCRVKLESPPGLGFGEAALILTRQFLMKPAIKNGVPVEDEVNIPINWDPLQPHAGSRIPDTSAEVWNADKVLDAVPWNDAPSVADVRAAYPSKARAEGKDGSVTLDCALNPHGGLSNCRTISEEPRGYGFVHAAEALASKFVGPTKDNADQPLAGVHTHLRFTFAASGLDTNTPAIGKPLWAGLPMAEDFDASFPAAAAKANILKARVVMSCLVATGGVLSDCHVESEDPANYGFGAAAASLAGKFRVAIWTAEGLPTVGGRVSVPIRYDLQKPPQPSAKP
jgi:hypothetical protein